MLPGSGPWQDPPGPAPEPAMVAARIADNEQRAADLEQKIFQGIDNRYAMNAQTAGGITTRLEGMVGSKLADLDYKAGKVVGKLVKNGNRQLGQAYTYAYPAGVVYPTDAQVAYGLESGDYLGSMGLAPTVAVSDAGSGQLLATLPGGLSGPVADPADALALPGPSYPADADFLYPGTSGTGPVMPTADPVAGAPVVLPEGGFGAAPCPYPMLIGGVTPPPCGAPPALGPDGYGSCPAGWIAASARPGYPPYCYPGPLLAVINPTEPGAPYGYDPRGSGAPLCQDGSLRPLGRPCAPSSTGAGPGTTPPPPAPGTTPPTTCPPGYHLEEVPGPAGGLVPTGDYRTTEPLSTQQGVPCPREVRPPLASQGRPGGFTQLSGITLFIPIPYTPGMQLPDPPSQWEVIDVHHWTGAPTNGGYQDFSVVVPTGYLVIADAESGIYYGSPVAQPWACTLPYSARSYFGPPGPPTYRCVPDAVPPAGSEQCHAPDVPTCGPKLDPHGPALGLADDDVCQAIQDAIATIGAQNVKISDWIGMATGSGSDDSTAVAVMKAVLGVKNPIVADLVNRFGQWLQKAITRAGDGVNCDKGKLLPLSLNRGVLRFINQWTGAVPPQVLEALDQIGNTICQSLLPGVAEADRAYLADQIDHEVWTCWVKAAGHHPDQAQSVRDAGRERPGFREAWLALKRGYIGQERYQKLVRAAGVIGEEDLNDLAALQCWWPGVEKLIRWMRKDVYDPRVVERFELDTDFDQKYTAETKKVADGLGISREYLLNEWRAHWENIGTTTMFECMRRLRPGKVDAQIATTQDDVRQALKQQDVPPFWIERLIAISYAKPTRVDVRRMWTLHLIEEGDLKGRILDLGYTDADADKMVEFWKADRDMKEARMNGLPTGRTLVNAYGRGELTNRELVEIAEKVSYYPGQVEEIEEAADLARDMAERKNAIGAVRRRFTRGLIGAADAAAELASVNIDGDEIERLLRWWEQVKKRTGKEASAAMLCQWRTSHLISAADQLAALMRVGWGGADAQHIVAQCTLDIAQKQQVQQQKAEAAAVRAAAAAAKREAVEKKAAAAAPRFRIPAQPANGTNGAASH